MKKMKFLISQLYLLALLALPLVATSCSDDDDNLRTEITSLGIDNGTTIVTGQSILFEPQISNVQEETNYTWSVNEEKVSTESTYTFKSNTTGTYTVQLAVFSNNETITKSINITVITPTFYVINEGQQNGSINRYAQNNWQYNIVEGLGRSSTVGITHKGYMYIVSKNSPMLVKMNLENNNIVGKVEDIEYGQGNNFCIINDETGILTTTTGTYKVNLNSLTIGDKLIDTDSSKDVYKTENYIFILDKTTIKVYNISDFSFKQDLTHPANTGFAQTKDGSLWAANENKLVKINVENLNSEELELPNALKVFYNQWAYTPTGLSASVTENALYFAHTVEEGFSVYGKDIYKYDIATKATSKFFTAPASDKSIYGAGIQVDPRNGDVYIIYTEDGWNTHYLNTNIYVADGVSGTQKSVIDYTGTYWFPSSITFQ